MEETKKNYSKTKDFVISDKERKIYFFEGKVRTGGFESMRCVIIAEGDVQ